MGIRANESSARHSHACNSMSAKLADPRLTLRRDWITYLVQGLSQFGKELDVSVKLNGLLADAGFVDIKTKIVHVRPS